MRRSDTKAKLDWLIANKSLWEDMGPQRLGTPRRNENSPLGVLRSRATEAGLYSPKSYWRDVEMSLLYNIEQIRRAEDPK